MIPTFSPDVLRGIVEKLPRGLAVQEKEGPDGAPFSRVTKRGGNSADFYPVVGISVPSLAAQSGITAARVVVNLGDKSVTDFNYRLLKFTGALPMGSLTQRSVALRAFAR